MGKRGPQGTIAGSSKREKVDEALAAGKTDAAIARRYGFSVSAVDRYRKAWLAAQPKGEALKVKEPKPLAADAPPQEQAKWHCDRIEARMVAAEKAAHPDEKQIAALYGQYTRALQHHAKVSGALDITEAQILRCAPWKRVQLILMRAVEKDFPLAAKAIHKALDDVCEGRI